MKLKLICILSITLLLFSSIATSGIFKILQVNALEQPVVDWIKTHGGGNYDWATSIVATADGGYVIAGTTESFGVGGEDFWLYKIDATGEIVWNRAYGGSGEENAYSLIKTFDGGFAILGTTTSYGAGGQDVWLVKTDSLGFVEWTNTYGESLIPESTYPSDEWGKSIIQTSDGGYLIAGGADARDYWIVRRFWIVKTDALGNEEWTKFLPSGTEGSQDILNSIIQCSDGGYIALGTTSGYWSPPGRGTWLVKIDPTGEMEWDQYFETNYGYCVRQTSDNGYIFTGFDDYELGKDWTDFWLVKTDSLGNLQWEKTYEPDYDTLDQAYSLEIVNDGYVIAGHTQENESPYVYNYWLLKTDFDGNLIWDIIVDDPNYDGSEPSLAVTSTDYVLAGAYDFWDYSGVAKVKLSSVEGYYSIKPLFDDYEIKDGGFLTSYFQVAKWDGENEIASNGVPVTFQSSIDAVPETLTSHSYLGLDGIISRTYDLRYYSSGTFEINVISGSYSGLPVNPPVDNPVVYHVSKRTGNLEFGTVNSYSAAAVARVSGEIKEGFVIENDGSELLDILYSQYCKTGVGVEFNLFKAKLGVVKLEGGISAEKGVSSGIDWQFSTPDTEVEAQIVKNSITRWILSNLGTFSPLAIAARHVIDSNNHKLGIDDYTYLHEVDSYLSCSGGLQAEIGLSSTKYGSSKAKGNLGYAGIGGEIELRTSKKIYSATKVGYLSELIFGAQVGLGLRLDLGFLKISSNPSLGEILSLSTNLGVELIYQNNELAIVELNFEIEIPREYYDALAFLELAVPLNDISLPSDLENARLCLQYSLPAEKLVQDLTDYISSQPIGEIEIDTLWQVFHTAFSNSIIPYSISLESTGSLAVPIAIKIGPVGFEIEWEFYEKEKSEIYNGFVYNSFAWLIENREMMAQSLNPIDFIIDNWIYSGLEDQPSATVIELTENQEHLYPHIYDNYGNHVGYNYATEMVDLEIPGSYYTDNGEGMFAVVLPSGINEFSIEVDGRYAQEIVEDYELRVTVLGPDRGDQIVYDGIIAQGTTNYYNIVITDIELLVEPDPVTELGNLKDLINQLPNEAFFNAKIASNLKYTLNCMIDEVIIKIEAGFLNGALNQLTNSIREKVDGVPKPKDWIIDLNTQVRVLTIIDHIITGIEVLGQES